MKEEGKKKDIPVVQPIPENLPEELLPLYDWWKANGTQLLTTVAIVAIVAAAVFGIRQYRGAKKTAANEELLKANSVEELETAVNQYGGTKAGNAARLRLAKAYFDAGNYQGALDTYETCISKGAPRGFEDIAMVGRACSLEGLGKLDDALAAYRSFQKEHSGSYLLQQAQFGEARVLALQGKKPEAKKLLENLKAKATGKPAVEMSIANLMDVIDRYTPRQKRSLFDMADEASKKGTAVVPAVKPVPVPAVKPAAKAATPAPAVKPATPAVKPAAKAATPAPAVKPATPAVKPAAKPATPAVKPATPAVKPAAKPATPAPAVKPATPAKAK